MCLCYGSRVILSRRQFGVSAGTLAASLALSQSVHASTLQALSLEEIVARSERAVVGIPVVSESEWRYVAGSRRIVTRTRFLQEADWLLDEEQGDEFFVLTLGGRIGDVAEKVPGEAALRLDERCLLFASQESDGLRRVIGMGQGHYLVEGADQDARITRGPSRPHLVGPRRGTEAAPRRRRVADVLDGVELGKARDLVRGAR